MGDRRLYRSADWLTSIKTSQRRIISARLSCYFTGASFVIAALFCGAIITSTAVVAETEHNISVKNAVDELLQWLQRAKSNWLIISAEFQRSNVRRDVPKMNTENEFWSFLDICLRYLGKARQDFNIDPFVTFLIDVLARIEGPLLQSTAVESQLTRRGIKFQANSLTGNGSPCSPDGSRLNSTCAERVVAELSKIVNKLLASQRPDRHRRDLPNYLLTESEIRRDKHPLAARFDLGISQYGLYSEEDDDHVDQFVETYMGNNLRLTAAEVTGYGTSLHFLLTTADNVQFFFKPKRWSPDVEVPLDQHHVNDFERHYSEIAAYHLDRTLGFRLVPPASGTVFDLVDIYNLLEHDPELRQTFFVSPAGNVCVYGKCKKCQLERPICANRTLLEGSIVYCLPWDNDSASWTGLRSPWRRRYNYRDIARWENSSLSSGYCDEVRAMGPPWSKERTILNVVDGHIFDFLQGNQDRHHFATYSRYGNDSFFITFDNGRGFGRAYHDEMSILAPLYQCCKVRLSTVKTLLDLQTAPVGEKLSDRMRRSLSKDRLSPVLNEAHLAALDRRVGIVLDQIYQCLQQVGSERPVIIDG